MKDVSAMPYGQDDAVARAAAVLGPVLVLLAVGVAFLGPVGFLFAVALLALAVGALSLAWRRAESRGFARKATALAAGLLGLAAAGLGLAANACVAEPVLVAVVSVILFDGTLLAGVALGRGLATRYRLVGPLIAAGLGLVGFFVALLVVAQYVFVLC